MTKTQMPEPVAYAIFAENGNIRLWSNEPRDLPDLDSLGPMDRLITTTQAEAYKDACVREALEEAVQICWEMQSKPEYGKDDKDRWLAIAESRIRALIPKE